MVLSDRELTALLRQAREEGWTKLALVPAKESSFEDGVYRVENLSMAHVRQLASISSLTHLELKHCKIGDDGARALASLSNLTHLQLFSNDIEARGASALASLPCLTYLDLSFNRIGAEGARALASLENLVDLWLEGNGIGDEGVRALQSLSRLAYLDLYHNDVTDLRPLASLPSLEFLGANGNPVDGVPKELLSRGNCLPALRDHWRAHGG